MIQDPPSRETLKHPEQEDVAADDGADSQDDQDYDEDEDYEDDNYDEEPYVPEDIPDEEKTPVRETRRDGIKRAKF